MLNVRGNIGYKIISDLFNFYIFFFIGDFIELYFIFLMYIIFSVNWFVCECTYIYIINRDFYLNDYGDYFLL